MDPQSYLSQLYFGDEALKGILVDSWSDIVKVKISRLTLLEAGKQPFDCKMTVEEPWLVFENANSIKFEPSGLIPNDFIEDISVVSYDETSSQYTFSIRTGRTPDFGGGGPINVLITARRVTVEHPLWREP